MTWTPDRIRALRERLRLDQAEMAKQLGYSSGNRVSEIERKDGRAPGRSILRLLDHLDIHGELPADRLVDGPEEAA